MYIVCIGFIQEGGEPPISHNTINNVMLLSSIMNNPIVMIYRNIQAGTVVFESVHHRASPFRTALNHTGSFQRL